MTNQDGLKALDEKLREQMLSGTGMCIGPFDHPHRCSAGHCNHCGLCDESEHLIEVAKSFARSIAEEAIGKNDNGPNHPITGELRYDTQVKNALRKEQRARLNTLIGGQNGNNS